MMVLLTWEPTEAERDQIAREWPADLQSLRQGDLDPGELRTIIPQVEVMVGPVWTIPKDLLSRAPELRLIHVLGHGVDGLLTPETVDLLRGRGVLVARSNPAAIAIAEFVIMSLIALTRRMVTLHNRLTFHGDWSSELKAQRGAGSLGGELYESALGLIGYGSIAVEIHKRAAAFGMEVGALARRPARLEGSGLDFVVPWQDIDAFLKRCDYLVLSVPLTNQTTHLINADRIRAM
ncbi:MAG: hypothetical protein GEU81_05340 [Nitriliruptorales bacterium]|nr:hypothetical protein [Nitriliruptorales bacterium]